MKQRPRVAVLCGGVGGVKLALGLDRLGADMAIIANTGDDFDHYGLKICPDIDTILYTLSGKVHPVQGWGRIDESRFVLDALSTLNEDPWFMLGDKDIALHLIRAGLLADGMTLTDATAILAERLGITAQLVPMADSPAPTLIATEIGTLAFQDYFVRHRCAPRATAVHWGGAKASSSPAAVATLTDPALDAIIICPSNPLLSIAPILAIPAIREALVKRRVPAVAVSPIVGGTAVKGPTAKMFAELGIAVTGLSVAKQYRGLIDVMILDGHDAGDVAEVEALGIRALVRPVLMTTEADKIALANASLDAARAIGTR